MKRPTLGWSILFLTLVLLGLGIMSVYNASVVEADRDFGNKFYFALQQLKWAGAGLALLIVASRLPLAPLRRLSFPLLIISLGLMLVVLIPSIGGDRVLGAKRWINLFGLTLQPSELLKLSLVIYLAHWLEKPRPLPSLLLLLAVILTLTMLQPDLGTAIVLISTGFLLYYLSGAPLFELLTLAATGVGASLLLILTSSYRRARLLTYLDPTRDPLGSSYHINQVLLALGSGGWFGVGLGRSRQKYQYLPEATTDSIFAVIGEETGFIGSLVIIVLLLALAFLCLRVALRSRLLFHQLLASGVAIWLAGQTLLNLSAMVALVPLTGIPLPLISYGGSSLVTILTALGLVINITHSEKI